LNDIDRGFQQFQQKATALLFGQSRCAFLCQQSQLMLLARAWRWFREGQSASCGKRSSGQSGTGSISQPSSSR
jgi:hypothetical protein